MSLGFTAGTTGRIITGSTSVLASATSVTVSIWANLTQACYNGTSNGGADSWLFDNSVNQVSAAGGGSITIQVYHDTVKGNLLEVDANWWTGGVGAWQLPGPAVGSWVHILVTYSNSSTANVPAIYYNGVGQGIATTLATPTQIVQVQAQPIAIGNGNSGATHAFGNGGLLYDVAAWSSILSSGEVMALANGARPNDVSPTSLQLWVPMDGAFSTEGDFGGRLALTQTNSTVGASNPPVEFPYPLASTVDAIPPANPAYLAVPPSKYYQRPDPWSYSYANLIPRRITPLGTASMLGASAVGSAGSVTGGVTAYPPFFSAYELADYWPEPVTYVPQQTPPRRWAIFIQPADPTTWVTAGPDQNRDYYRSLIEDPRPIDVGIYQYQPFFQERAAEEVATKTALFNGVASIGAAGVISAKDSSTASFSGGISVGIAGAINVNDSSSAQFSGDHATGAAGIVNYFDQSNAVFSGAAGIGFVGIIGTNKDATSTMSGASASASAGLVATTDFSNALMQGAVASGIAGVISAKDSSTALMQGGASIAFAGQVIAGDTSNAFTSGVVSLGTAGIVNYFDQSNAVFSGAPGIGFAGVVSGNNSGNAFTQGAATLGIAGIVTTTDSSKAFFSGIASVGIAGIILSTDSSNTSMQGAAAIGAAGIVNYFDATNSVMQGAAGIGAAGTIQTNVPTFGLTLDTLDELYPNLDTMPVSLDNTFIFPVGTAFMQGAASLGAAGAITFLTSPFAVFSGAAMIGFAGQVLPTDLSNARFQGVAGAGIAGIAGDATTGSANFSGAISIGAAGQVSPTDSSTSQMQGNIAVGAAASFSTQSSPFASFSSASAIGIAGLIAPRDSSASAMAGAASIAQAGIMLAVDTSIALFSGVIASCAAGAIAVADVSQALTQGATGVGLAGFVTASGAVPPPPPPPPPPSGVKTHHGGYPVAPEYLPSTRQHTAVLARTANLAIQGKLNATLGVTLNPNATSTLVDDPRIGPDTHIDLSPLSLSAALLKAAGIWFSDQTKGSVVINHISRSNGDLNFSMIMIG